ncbi:hypothetical protein [Rosenbergiella epipactidis]|uniref:hypothetical protein n=1 Tax=Rosenbergiella epipactidis TaxID=1544694 RepID=UPI001F4ED021|nr:hypothetical protein [Rosenbergiella epipactidis]
MKITKTPILDSDNQGIVGFEITLSGYFFNRNKAIDKQDKLANQEAELEYEINRSSLEKIWYYGNPWLCNTFKKCQQAS